MSVNIAFGPIPSRRLGHSLGINNIPPKSCSYSCVYCQVGATDRPQIEPGLFYPPDAIFDAVDTRLREIRKTGGTVDYLTFVPDGEPTLDVNLGNAIERLRTFDIPIAVISNASLLWHEDVRAALGAADWVSLKVDSVDDRIWHQINRPHRELTLARVHDGIRRFVGEFQGKLVSETMLLGGINEAEADVSAIAEFLQNVGITRAYLAIPTRPTAESDLKMPDESALNRAFQIFAAAVPRVEYLIGYEGDEFGSGGDAREDLLGITAVHPMRVSAIERLLQRTGQDWSLVQTMVDRGELTEVTYLGNRYYLRHLSRRHDA
jgi:wyosine [tRNA(Phe)-imidazoG37] synthetase (radical SAM superfamily)